MASQANALRQGSLGGAPLILSPRLQGMQQVPTTLSQTLMSSQVQVGRIKKFTYPLRGVKVFFKKTKKNIDRNRNKLKEKNAVFYTTPIIVSGLKPAFSRQTLLLLSLVQGPPPLNNPNYNCLWFSARLPVFYVFGFGLASPDQPQRHPAAVLPLPIYLYVDQ